MSASPAVPFIRIQDYSQADKPAVDHGYTLQPAQVAQMLDTTLEKALLLFEYSKKGDGPLDLVSTRTEGIVATMPSVVAYKKNLESIAARRVAKPQARHPFH